MKGFHLICAKCGSMDLRIDWTAEEGMGDCAYVVCNNYGELTNIEQHNDYILECKQNKRWYLS